MPNNGRKENLKPWKKGQSGNPKGRPPVLRPELQKDIEKNRNAWKQLILLYLNLSEDQIAERQRDRSIPIVEKMLGSVIERTCLDGDVLKYRSLLEIVFGKLPEDAPVFEMSPEEKAMIIDYRRRIEEQEDEQQGLLPNSPEDP